MVAGDQGGGREAGRVVISDCGECNEAYPACRLWRADLPDPAHAQTFPSRPVTIIVPFPAGGPTDTMARIFAEHMRRTLGQPMIVENVDRRGRAPSASAARCRGARRLHAQPRQLDQPRRRRRALSGDLAHPSNDLEPIAQLASSTADDRRQERSAGKGRSRS